MWNGFRFGLGLILGMSTPAFVLIAVLYLCGRVQALLERRRKSKKCGAGLVSTVISIRAAAAASDNLFVFRLDGESHGRSDRPNASTPTLDCEPIDGSSRRQRRARKLTSSFSPKFPGKKRTKVAYLSAHRAEEITMSPYATHEDFIRLFTDEANSLYLLAFLLTAKHERAEQCFVAGLDECVRGNVPFKSLVASLGSAHHHRGMRSR